MTDSPAQPFLTAADQCVQANDAQTAYRNLVAACLADPASFDAWFKLGAALMTIKKFDVAAACFLRANAARPDDAYTLTNIGWNLHLSARTAEGLPYLHRAVEVNPTLPLGWTDLGHLQIALGDLDAAIASSRKGVEYSQGDCIHNLGLAFALLTNGHLSEGLREYESRFRYRMPEMLTYPFPRWDGKKINRLFIQAEQGLGDTLMGLRFIHEASRRAKEVIFYCHAELRTLCEANVALNVECVPMPMPLPSADAWCPLLSLPLVYGLEMADLELPKYRPPYIKLPYSTERTIPRTSSFRVGICWKGNPAHDNARFRDIPLDCFLPLTTIPGVTIHSLQHGPPAKVDMDNFGVHGLIEDLGPYLSDYNETARVMQTLDLVVTVDTSIVHLAGAANVNAMVLVNQLGSDWRWLQNKAHTPWYPSVEIIHRMLYEETWTGAMSLVRGRIEAIMSANAGAKKCA